MKNQIWATAVRWGYRGTLIAVLMASMVGAGALLSQIGRLFVPEGNGGMGFVNLSNINLQSIYDGIVSIFVVVVPVALAWYARTYMRTTASQKRISVMGSLAGAAINYAEDCQHRGDLELIYNSLALPENLARNPSPGQQKLLVASSWLVTELKKMGIKRVSLDEAMKWVAAEFQKTVGDLRAAHSVSAMTDLAADLLGQLSRGGHITLPGNTLEAASLIQSIADWAASQLGVDEDVQGRQRELAMARIAPSTLMAANPTESNNKISPEVRLTLLARQAVDFVKDLQQRDRLRMSERDTAMAWLIQKVQQEDIPVSRDQISEAIGLAFEQRRALAPA